MANDVWAEARKVINEKARLLLEERDQISREIKELQERNLDILRALRDCEAAMRLFGNSGESPPSGPPDFKDQRPIREIVLDMLRAADPKPMKAKELQARLDAGRPEPIHWKTVGMTLYRLSQQGLVRREGHNWFFVPQGDAEKKNPGADTPGLDFGSQ